MPKIIEDLEQSILNEACLIIENEGISNLSIRYLSSKLNIAPGTIYNYFKNKNELIGHIIRIRFDEALRQIEKTSFNDIPFEEVMSSIIEILGDFAGPYIKYHVSLTSENNSLSGKTLHSFNQVNELYIKLSEIIKNILINHKLIKSKSTDIDKDAKVFSKLAILCINNSDMSIHDIFDAMHSIG